MSRSSLAQARAHVVVKQGLGGGAGLATLGDATAASGCIYGTAPTCYLGYGARVDGFAVADLDRELYERRSLVRLRAMRGSSYVVPVDLLPAVVGATEEVTVGALDRILKYVGVGVADYEALAARIEAAMAGEPPMTKAQIKAALGPDRPGRGDALTYVVAVMARQCRVVRATVRGGWRSDSYTYALWDDWLGAPLERIDPVPARTELARMYLRAYGPATADDLRWWAGWKITQAGQAIEALGGEAVEVDVDGSPQLVLADEVDALLGADPDGAVGTRLLPVWDSYLMGWFDRRRFVADPQRPLVYDKAGNGTSALLIDGVAAGVWELEVERKGGLTVRVAPFARLTKTGWAGVEAAAERIAASVGAPSLDLERVRRAPRPLAESSARNAFLAPIRLGA